MMYDGINNGKSITGLRGNH